MALTKFTSYDAIRAVLGVSAKEVKDETLALPMFESQFLLEMLDVDSGTGAVVAQYDTISQVAAASRSAAQQQFYDLVGLMAAFSVARQLLTGAPMSMPQKITDGKAAVERFDSSNFDRLRAGVSGSYGQTLRRLKTALLKIAPSANIPVATARVFAAGVGLGTDPVTGV